MSKKKPWLLRDPVTDEEWEAKAKHLGVESGEVLKAQVKLADEILEEIFAEEERERAEKA